MRLIDADHLKELILKERDAIPKTVCERYGLGVEKPNNHGNSMRGGIRKALRCMEQCPTIEAEPVKQGKWETANDGTHFCPHCGYDAPYAWDDINRYFINSADDVPDRQSNYCPNCGAYMRDYKEEG